MNNLFKELIDLLNKEFKKFDLNESVQLNPSKLPEFDMQINKLISPQTNMEALSVSR